jgi:glyoxylase-like metal-dependent hydrolase (beta-lactamase superfamily II)
MTFRPAGSLALAFGLAAAAALAQPHPLETSVEKARAMLTEEDLGDGVYVFRAPSDLEYWTATNSVVIVNDDDVTVFDSCTRAVTAKALIAEIRNLTEKPVRVLVNSHWHQDHWSGNGEYAKAFPGLRIVASAETRAYMTRMMSNFFATELADNGLTRRREELAAAIKTGKLADGSRLTPEVRARKEASIAMASQFEAEIQALPRVLPNVVYRDEMTLWSGRREMRLMSVTGDATGSTVLYLPESRILVTGDVLVSPEDGKGPPPWTTNSYAITPWLETLRRLEELHAAAIVPGQGPAMHDGAYLRRTIELFAAVLDQVHAALERGLVRLSQIQAAVNVDAIGQAYAPGVPLNDEFRMVVANLVKKSAQEALDGVANLN